MYVNKITSFCQVLKEMHTKEYWFLSSASWCICLSDYFVGRIHSGMLIITVQRLSVLLSVAVTF